VRNLPPQGSQPAGAELSYVDVAEDVVAVIPATLEPGTSNSTLVIDNRDVVVVDTMILPRLGGEIQSQLRRRGLRARVVVNTHPHVDHVGGNAAFTDARVLSHSVTVDSVRRLAADTSFLAKRFPLLAEEITGLRLRVPDPLDSDALDSDVCGAGIRILTLGPAHTPVDLAFWLPERRLLIAGDLCFNQITPIALPGHATIRGWIRVLAELIELQPLVVIPGHGPPAGPETLTVLKAYFEALLHTVREAVADAVPVHTRQSRLQPGPVGEWAEPNRTALNLAVAYAELTGDISGLPTGIPVPSRPTRETLPR
jgi:glyoxylase-like metal-dependent hydrolase (beta-lactamase superfamily II)